MTSFPNSVWDGDSGNRDSNEGMRSACDHRDWTRMIAEVSAMQQHILGHEHDRIGSVNIYSGLTVDESGDAALHKSRFVLDNVEITITDAGAAGAHGKVKLYTFTDGHADIYTARLILSLIAGVGGISNSAVLDIGVGTSEVSVANDTLATTEQNILPKIDVTLTGGTKTIESGSTTYVDLDGETEIFLNVAIEDASCSANDTLIISGTFTLVWSNYH